MDDLNKLFNVYIDGRVILTQCVHVDNETHILSDGFDEVIYHEIEWLDAIHYETIIPINPTIN